MAINPKELFQLCESIPTKDTAQLEQYAQDENYIGNQKFDGERCIMIKTSEKLIMLSRGGNIITYKFPDIADGVSCEDNFIIDGEIISLNGDFSNLLTRALTSNPIKIKELVNSIPVKYMVFDILSLNDKVLMNEPLRNRVEILKGLMDKNFSENDKLEMCKYGDIKELWNEVIENDDEGIIVKDLNASYEANKRSKGWLKYKNFKETTITITSYTENNAGIRGETDEGIKVQIAGGNTQAVLNEFENKGYATINIQYLSQSKSNGKFRFPSYRGLA